MGQTLSGGEVLQEYLSGATLLKASNTLGVEHMKTEAAKGVETQRNVIAELIRDVGSEFLWIDAAIPPLPAANLGREWTFAVNKSA